MEVCDITDEVKDEPSLGEPRYSCAVVVMAAFVCFFCLSMRVCRFSMSLSLLVLLLLSSTQGHPAEGRPFPEVLKRRAKGGHHQRRKSVQGALTVPCRAALFIRAVHQPIVACIALD